MASVDPAPDDGHQFPSTHELRRPFPDPRPLRRDWVAQHERASQELAGVDRELELLVARRRACLRRLDALRTRLNRRWTDHHVRRSARVDEAPVPPAPPDAVAIDGTDLRHVCLTLLRRHGPQDLRALHGLLHCYGYVVGGPRPVQRLGDAMAYEQRCGRAERIARGVYAATGEGPGRVRPGPAARPVPAAPLPWRRPTTGDEAPLADPEVANDVEHWTGGAWPDPGEPPADLDPPLPDPPPPPPGPVGDDSPTNRRRRVHLRGGVRRWRAVFEVRAPAARTSAPTAPRSEPWSQRLGRRLRRRG